MWWTKINGKVEEHRVKIAALMTISGMTWGDAKVEECGLYKRNPSKYPEEPNLLPKELAKAQDREFARQIKAESKRR